MGWNVKVEVKCSGVHGRGVFAAETIPAGARVWQVDASMHVCTPGLLARLQWPALSQALYSGYLHEPSGLFLWYTDGMQFMNHGDRSDANVGLHYWPRLEDDHIVALRDIEAGEELREDYRGCLQGGLAPDHWMAPLYRAFCPAHYGFLLGLFAQEANHPGIAAAAAGTKVRRVAMSASRKTGFDRTAPNPDARQAA